MGKTSKDLAILFLAKMVLCLLLYLPFYLNLNPFLGLNFSKGLHTIYQNFDGTEYIVIAKSFYNSEIIRSIQFDLPSSYFPSHFPGYPLLIAMFAPLLGFLKSMLFVSFLFTVLSTFAFYNLVKDFKLSSQPLYLSLIFLILPARWLIVHSVGSPEPVFIFFTILAFYFFLKFESTNKYLFLILTGLFGSFAQLTRPPGILIFISLILYIFIKNFKQKRYLQGMLSPITHLPLILIPLSLLSIFYLFYLQTGDFLAYFHSGDNIHLTFPPFQVFNKHQFWVGDIWLEDIIYLLLLGFLGGVMLIKKGLTSLGIFVLVYLGFTSLAAHRDLSRYALPIFPFCLIAFSKVLESKEFKIALGIILLAIYLYAQNFIIENTAPIANLAAFN